MGGSPRLKVLIFMICISVVLGLDFVEGRFVVEKNSISIVSPYSIRAKYDASIGNFGVPDYGGSLVGTVVYPQKGAFGCSAFEGDKPFKSKTPRPNILLVDRGGSTAERPPTTTSLVTSGSPLSTTSSSRPANFSGSTASIATFSSSPSEPRPTRQQSTSATPST